MGPRAGLQRHAELAPRDRREPDRGRRTLGQDRLRSRLPLAQRRPDTGKTARSFRLRHVLHLFDFRISDGRRELCRDTASDAGDRRRTNLRRMDGGIRLRARARGRAHRQHWRRRVPGRVRRAQKGVRRLEMPHVVKSTIIDASTHQVWSILRDFNGHDRWHPEVATSQIERNQTSDRIGCVRRFKLADGSELREQLLALSDLEQSFSYCLLDTPIPMFNYVAHVRLLPVTDGDRTFWHWESRFTTRPADAAEITEMVGEQIYQAGFEAIRQHLKGAA